MKKRQMIYVVNARVPSQKAHVYQIFKVCEAFAEQGIKVELWHPRRKNPPEMNSIKDVFGYYGVHTPFSLRSLSCLDWPLLQRFSLRFWFLIQVLSFVINAVKELRKIDEDALIYTRDLWLVFRLAKWKQKGYFRNPIIYEAHTFPEGLRRHWVPLLKYLDQIVVLTKVLKKRFEHAGVPSSKLLIAPDGVDIRLYKGLPNQIEVRNQLQLPLERPLVVYTGHFFPWKGVDTLIESARLLPEVQVLLVGGTKNDQKSVLHKLQKRGISNVRLAGYVPPPSVPLYLVAADILVLPNSARATISREYTSPLKLFEYMAAGKPIVATDLPSICEVLTHEHNAILVPPDNPKALAEGIKRLLNNQELARSIGKQAYQDIRFYTWLERAKRILHAVGMEAK